MILQEEKKHNEDDLSSNNTQQREQDSLPALRDGQPAVVAGCGMGGFTACDIEELEASQDATTPLLLTRGAHIHPPTLIPQKTHIDWISFTCDETVAILEQLAIILIPNVKIISLKHGQPGYKFTKEINLHGQSIGRLAFGASHNRNLFTLTGKGTAQVNWSIFLQYYQILTEPKLSRIDIALDFFKREVYHDAVLFAYDNGSFTPVKSSKKPSINIITGTDGNGNNKGRTITIGNKKSGKCIRTYEKGHEQYGKLFDNLPDDEKPDMSKMSCFDISINYEDTPLMDWYRMEVQYGNADRELPIEMISNSDEYFSGAYPYCEEVIKMSNGKTPPRLPNSVDIDIELMFKHMRDQYGSFITTMVSMGMTPEQIVKKVANGKQSQRIIKAGGLDKIKPYIPPK